MGAGGGDSSLTPESSGRTRLVSQKVKKTEIKQLLQQVFNTVFSPVLMRLGFNPTSRNERITSLRELTMSVR